MKEMNFYRIRPYLIYLVMYFTAIGMFYLAIETTIDIAVIYMLIYIWVLLPCMGLVISVLAGRRDDFGVFKWAIPVVIGALDFIAAIIVYGSNEFDMSFIYELRLTVFLFGVFFSHIGIAIGHFVYVKEQKKKLAV